MLDQTEWLIRARVSLYVCQSVGGAWCAISNSGFGRHSLVRGRFVRQLLVVVAQQTTDLATINWPDEPFFSGGATLTLRALATAFMAVEIDQNHPDQ